MLGGAGTGLLTIPLCVILVGLAQRRPPPDVTWGARGGAIVLLLGAALYLLGVVLARTQDAAWLVAGLALPPMAFGTLWLARGAPQALRYAFPLGFTAFALPWELVLRELDAPLQIISARLAVGLLRGLGYAVEWWNEYTFWDADYYLVVNETCSGMNMLVTLGMYALIFGWVTLRTLPQRAALVASTVPLALLVNGLRVAAIWLMGKHGGNELAQGFWHTGSAYLLFLPVFWVLYRLARALQRWLPERPRRA